MFALISLVSLFALGAWLSLLPAIKARRMSNAVRAPMATDRCEACGASAIELVASRVVRCCQCGIVSGEGLAEWNRRRRAHRLESMPQPERTRLALDKLQEALNRLDSARSSLNEAVVGSRWELVGLSLDRGRQKQQALGAGTWQLGLAHALTKEAVELAASDEHLTAPPALEDSALLLSLDTSWLTDGLTVNLTIHKRIKGVLVQLDALQRQTEALIEQVKSRALPPAQPDLSPR